ncbi:hypothetical protein QOT17_002171 [Balamuthia mandrillaris]
MSLAKVEQAVEQQLKNHNDIVDVEVTPPPSCSNGLPPCPSEEMVAKKKEVHFMDDHGHDEGQKPSSAPSPTTPATNADKAKERPFVEDPSNNDNHETNGVDNSNSKNNKKRSNNRGRNAKKQPQPQQKKGWFDRLKRKESLTSVPPEEAKEKKEKKEDESYYGIEVIEEREPSWIQDADQPPHPVADLLPPHHLDMEETASSSCNGHNPSDKEKQVEMDGDVKEGDATKGASDIPNDNSLDNNLREATAEDIPKHLERLPGVPLPPFPDEEEEALKRGEVVHHQINDGSAGGRQGKGLGSRFVDWVKSYLYCGPQ